MHSQSTAVGGVYVVWLSETRFYGGRSRDIANRCASHLRALQEGTHINHFMQNVYNKHKTFRYEVAVACELGDTEGQILAEQGWLNQNVGKPGCMNISPSAQVPSWEGKKHTAETRKKISLSNMGREGRPRTLEERERMRQIGLNSRGRIVSAETRRLMTAAALERPKPGEATREKMSEKQRARHAANGGQTDRQKAATAAANRLRVYDETNRKVWFYDPADRTTKRILESEVEAFLAKGWVKGRPPWQKRPGKRHAPGTRAHG